MTKHITAQLGDSMCLTAVPTPWAHVGSSKSSRQKGADKAPARPNHVRKESSSHDALSHAASRKLHRHSSPQEQNREM